MKNKINILLIGIILLTPHHLFAKYKTEFIPSISINETYDDNIDLDSTNEKSDWITSISPRIALNIFSQKNNFSLNYFPSIVRYKNEDNNNTVRHTGSFRFNEELLKNLQFNLSDTYIMSEDPLETTEGVVGIRGTRNTYQRNNWASSINYIFGPSNSFLLGYSHSWLENDDVTLDDGKIFDPYSKLLYWFNQKHGMELSVGYTDAEFSRDDNGIPDDDYSGGRSGLRYLYKGNPHTTFSIGYDYTYRNFTGLNNEEDYMVHEASLGFEKQISEDLSYNISAGYFVQDREYSEDGNGVIFDSSLTKKMNRGSFSIDAKGGWDEVILEAERRGFTKYQQLGTAFTYNITRDLINYFSISYRHDKDSINRESRTVRANYGLRWLISRYYSATIDYLRATRDDDNIDEEYSDNRVMLGIRWSRPYR